MKCTPQKLHIYDPVVVHQSKGCFMNDDFNKYMQIISGANLKKSQEKQLSDADRKKLSDAYFELFYNLTATNWVQGGNLGHAWYVAINQMKSYVATKSAKNPAGLYLRQLFAAHNARWGQLMMTSPHREDTVDVSAEKRAEWKQRIAQKINAALKTLNTITAEYELKKQNPQLFNMAAQNIAMQIQLRARQNGGMGA